jgi:NAD dependent epimerase/dehydratase family enzyme
MRIVLAGGSGFLGQTLAAYFLERGFEVVVLTRRASGNGEMTSSPLSSAKAAESRRCVGWDACTLGPWRNELEGALAVVNLTGKSVNCRYNARNRREILESRVNSTRVIGQAIAACKEPPRVWLNASTATVYKHTFGPAWDENGQTEATAEAKDRFSVEVA